MVSPLFSRLVVPFLALLLFGTGAAAATIEASVDRNPVASGESFTLSLSADANPDGDPDLAPLEQDFDILAQSQNSQISDINGRWSRRIEWQITLMAKREGTVPIPAIAFGSDHSNALTVTVVAGNAGKAAGADSDLFLEVAAEPKNPYVQAQVIYTVRVLSRIHFGGDLSEPAVDDAVVEKLGDDRRYTTLRGNESFTVIERKYAIFPQKSGHLRIPPLTLEAQVSGGSGSVFSPFFNQPGRALRLSSEAVELEVRPIPPEFTGANWLPAADLVLEDSWAHQTPQAAVGEPLTRTLMLKARGATVGVLPALAPDLGSGNAGDIKQYPDQPELKEAKSFDGVTSSRQEKTALIVSRPGTYRLPAVEIPWWNTRTGHREVARLPERILTVLPAAHAPRQDAAKPPVPEAAAPKPAEPAPQATPVPAPVSGGMAAGSDVWFWLALCFGVGWLATLVVFCLRLRRRSAEPTKAAAPAMASGRQALAAVERACRADDADGARRALLDWAAVRWPDAPALSLDELERRCGGELGSAIGSLNRVLYGRGGADWHGEDLWSSLRAYAAQPSPKAGSSPDELEPLYRR